MIWLGMESPSPTSAFYKQEATFAAAISWPKTSLPRQETVANNPAETIKFKWYGSYLPGIVLPMPAPYSGFFTTIETRISEQLGQICALCTASDLTSSSTTTISSTDYVNSPSYHNLRRIVPGFYPSSISCSFWDQSNREEAPVLIAASSRGTIFRLVVDQVIEDNARLPSDELICLAERQSNEGKPPMYLPTWEPLTSNGKLPKPYIAQPCGNVVS